MDGGKSDAALQRIDAALARIEAAARKRPGDGLDWEQRHQRLREAVNRSLQQLDDLIATQSEAAE